MLEVALAPLPPASHVVTASGSPVRLKVAGKGKSKFLDEGQASLQARREQVMEPAATEASGGLQ